jgi:dihydroorotase
MDLTIEGKAYIKNRIEQVCIAIEDGKIVKIGKILPKGEEHYRFSKELILPAGIDIHVHFREPGFTHKEDFSTGTTAAAFGGISCIFDMPNTSPPTTTKKALLDKIDIAKKKSYIDFGLYAGINNENIEEIENFAKYCNAFKIYLGSSTNTLLLSMENLIELLKKTEILHKKPLMIHAEDKKCLEKHKIIENDLIDHLKSHPDVCEVEAISQIIKNTKNEINIHICHISSSDSIELLKNTKKSKKISIGVTPHHILFSVNIKKQILPSSFYKVNPPLRSEFDVESLREHLIKSFVDILESDHAPHTYDEKNTSFEEAPSGIPGVETMYPIFLAWVNKGLISLNRLISSICIKPAQLFNLEKGEISEGNDADLIVVNLKNIQKIKSENLHSKCEWTPYEGMPAIFPTHLFVRGQPIVEDSILIGEKGFGKQVKKTSEE